MKTTKYPTYFLVLFIIIANILPIRAQSTETYAEKLGWKKGDRVVILHVDDAGMSYDSNQGAIQAMEQGIANSVSVMMPCPWVPAFVNYLKEHPNVDAGLHLTLTSEWKDYRWEPLTGAGCKGLIDGEGALWRSVSDVVKHASPREVQAEIMAQVARARKMGFNPTHLDSHMGTLFARPAFIKKYIKTGLKTGIPVMFPGGHNTFIAQQNNLSSIELLIIRKLGQKLWNKGFPILDDLHNYSYDWIPPGGSSTSDEELQKFKIEKYSEALRSLKPGVTMIIMHCTAPTEVFQYISASGPTRKGDLLAMLDPALKKVIEQEGIILTTWRELKQRRDKVGK